MQQLDQAWVGIDAGKGHRQLVVIDGEGRRLVSRRVANDEPKLTAAIDAVRQRGKQLTWAIELADGPAALVITLLLLRGQRLLYLPGVAVNRISGAYRGEGKDRRQGRRDHRRPSPHAPRPARAPYARPRDR